MPREYSQALADYAISRERYLELKHKCYQYPEWIRERNDSYELSAGSFDGMPRGSSNASSAVERKADRAMKSADLVELVERCLHDAAGGDMNVIPELERISAMVCRISRSLFRVIKINLRNIATNFITFLIKKSNLWKCGTRKLLR